MSDKSLDEKTREFGVKCFGGGRGVEEELGAENEVREGEEIFPAENDGEKMSESSSNKRMKGTSIDRLSALPDSLIIHILSLLDVSRAAITSVLSKRWKFLWTELPRLEFWESWECKMEKEKIREFVAGIGRTLAVRSGCYLEKFAVNFTYDECFASDVDVWVEFAVKNKVKEVSLLLNSFKDFYTLPQTMYSNPSLTELALRRCVVAPQRTIEWQSLTSLYIEEVELPQHVIDQMLSSCPVLHSLDLKECWGFNCLEVKSRSLYALDVSDAEEGDTVLEISAPSIHCLQISMYPEERKLRLTNVQSLVRVFIDFTGYDLDSSSMEVMSNTNELFESIQHVNQLDLGRQCFEVLSMLAMNGWQLPQSRRRRLEVSASSEYEHTVSGVIGLLESSPSLETLVIEGYETDGESFTFDPAEKSDLDCDLLHLKTVNIRNFADPNGEPMLTLARILLKRATILEKLVIVIDVEDTGNFVKIGQTLLTYPRSSQKAVVIFR